MKSLFACLLIVSLGCSADKSSDSKSTNDVADNGSADNGSADNGSADNGPPALAVVATFSLKKIDDPLAHELIVGLDFEAPRRRLVAKVHGAGSWKQVSPTRLAAAYPEGDKPSELRIDAATADLVIQMRSATKGPAGKANGALNWGEWKTVQSIPLPTDVKVTLVPPGDATGK